MNTVADNCNWVFRGLAAAIIVTVLPATAKADACAQIAALERFEATGIAPDGSTCETFLGLANVSGVSCYWKFPFRSDEAIRFSDDMWGLVTSCRKGIPSILIAPINHPDSYYLRELLGERGVYRVAMKDKGAVSRTLIFLSFELGG